jgi:predicted permease
MLKNYLLVAWRNLLRNKTYSSLNVLGLSVGMAVAVLIMLWVVDEMQFDHFHTKIENLYQLHQSQHYEGETFTFTSMPPPLASELENKYPGVVDVIRTTWGGEEVLLNVDDKRFYQKMLAVDSSFFEVFSFPLIAGDAKKALNEPYNVVISEETAQKLFGTTDVIGETVRYENRDNFKVSAVLGKMPHNSSLRFDILIPYRTYAKFNSEWLSETEWGNNNTPMYAEIKAGTDIAALNKKINKLLQKYQNNGGPGHSKPEPFFFPLAKERLYSKWENGKNVGGRISYVRWFSILAFFVLVIACVNFMNLSTARASRRSREIGIRKSVGAPRRRIISQFLGESVFMAFLALFIALGLVLLFLPAFNELTEKKLSFQFWQPQIAGLLLLSTVLTGLISGLYPAIYMSGFQVIKVLKGAFRSGSMAVNFRKGLVVFQFSLCALLIVGSIIVYQQIQHFQNMPLGFNRENVLRVPIRGDLAERYDPVRNELKRIKGVVSASTSGMNITSIGNSTSNLNWQGKRPEDQILFVNMNADPKLLETYKIKLIEGRDFQEGNANDTLSILFNELAVKRMGLKAPVSGQTVNLWDQDFRIIGVMEDFHFNSINAPIEPLFFVTGSWRGQASIRVDQSRPLSETIADIGAVFKKHNAAYPFEYEFVDKDFNELFKSEQLIGKLAGVFSFLAIFVACLGLFGLAAFSAEQRTKEIGVRKVLGASLGSIVGLMSREFLILVFASLVIASPLAWFVMNNWLNQYEYRIEISWWVFAFVAVLTLSVAFLTVTFQSLKAALINPIKSLRSE